MTKEEFGYQIQRLRTRWKNAFDNEFVQLLLYRTSHVTADHFTQVVNRFIGDLPISKPPLMTDFMQALGEMNRAHKKYSLGELQPFPKCGDCADSGFIRLTRNELYEPWAKWASGSAPCHCSRGGELIDAGRRRNLDFGPKFNDKWLKSYSVIREKP